MAESTKQVPGNYVPLSEHKAEMEKLEAQLTLKLEKAHQQAKQAWESSQRDAVHEVTAALQKELSQWKADCGNEKKLRLESENALLHERKQNIECRVLLDEESDAKTIVVQRYMIH